MRRPCAPLPAIRCQTLPKLRYRLDVENCPASGREHVSCSDDIDTAEHDSSAAHHAPSSHHNIGTARTTAAPPTTSAAPSMTAAPSTSATPRHGEHVTGTEHHGCACCTASGHCGLEGRRRAGETVRRLDSDGHYEPGSLRHHGSVARGRRSRSCGLDYRQHRRARIPVQRIKSRTPTPTPINPGRTGTTITSMGRTPARTTGPSCRPTRCASATSSRARASAAR